MVSEDVAIFWDYENCHAAVTFTGYEIVKKIRSVVHHFGTVKLFKAYLELSDPATFAKSLTIRSELQSSGVSLTDCPHNGRKDVADKMMLVDMLAYAIDNPAPSTIVLISGDRDFAYAVSILRLRRYRVVIISLPTVHTSLKVQASVFLDWNIDILAAEVAECSLPRTFVGQRPNNLSPQRGHPPSFLRPITKLDTDVKDVDLMDHFPRDLNGFRTSSDLEGSSQYNARSQIPGWSNISDTSPLIAPPIAKATYRSDSAPMMHCPSASPTLVLQPISPTPIRNGHQVEPTVIPEALPLAPKVETTPVAAQVALPRNPPHISVQTLVTPGSPPHIINSYHHTPTPQSPLKSSPKLQATRSVQTNGPFLTFQVPSAIPEPVVPHVYQPLIQQLKSYRSRGIFRCLRSNLAVELIGQDKMVYKRAGVEKFGQYVGLAEKAGMIELGGKEGDAWIALCPEWFNAKTG